MRTAYCLLLILAACNRGPNVPTSAENQDLDAASRMLDNAETNLSEIDENGLSPTVDPQT